jgi:diaminohydroxyphosphoribosylaminopyrimidine deaminase/5-amino-6-(5-phosphoribosylamino)uracil reductase
LRGEAAADLNAGYLANRTQGRPLVTLKLATTLDGRIATKRGDSRWITGAAARARAHLLRARSDAVLVGSGTAVADNPRLDVRLDGLEAASPLRVVLDGRLRLPLTHDLVIRAKVQPSWLMTHRDGPRDRIEAYQAAGVEVIPIAADQGGNLSVAAALAALAQRGVTRLLVEGGGHVAAAFLRAGLVDRLVWFHAPKVIGGDGVPAVAGFGLVDLAGAPGFALKHCHRIGDDLVESYARVN